MKINEKISLLKKTTREIKNFSKNLNNDRVSEAKISELNKEIQMLKDGINETIEELEKILEEDNARS